MGNTFQTVTATQLAYGVSEFTLIQTKYGPIKICKFLDTTVEVWADVGWVECKIVKLGKAPSYQVCLSNGAYLICSRDTLLPSLQTNEKLKSIDQNTIICGGSQYTMFPVEQTSSPSIASTAELSIRTSSQETQETSSPMSPHSLPEKKSKRRLKTSWYIESVNELKLGEKLTPLHEIPHEDLIFSGVSPDDAFQMGKHRKIIPREICGNASQPGFSPGAIRAFISGWASSNEGVLIGTSEEINYLRNLAFRAGLTRSQTTQHNDEFSLYLGKSNCAKYGMKPENFGTKIQLSHPKIDEIKKLNRSDMMYALLPLDCTSPAFYANGAMVVFDANYVATKNSRPHDERSYFRFAEKLMPSKASSLPLYDPYPNPDHSEKELTVVVHKPPDPVQIEREIPVVIENVRPDQYRKSHRPSFENIRQQRSPSIDRQMTPKSGRRLPATRRPSPPSSQLAQMRRSESPSKGGHKTSPTAHRRMSKLGST